MARPGTSGGSRRSSGRSSSGSSKTRSRTPRRSSSRSGRTRSRTSRRSSVRSSRKRSSIPRIKSATKSRSSSSGRKSGGKKVGSSVGIISGSRTVNNNGQAHNNPVYSNQMPRSYQQLEARGLFRRRSRYNRYYSHSSAPRPRNSGCVGCVGGCLGVVALLFLMITFLTVISGLVIAIRYNKEDSQTISDQRINDFVTADYFQDELDWIDNEGDLLEGLIFFENATSISPYVALLKPVLTGNTEADKIKYAENLYDKIFQDEQHFLLVYIEDTNPEEFGYLTYVCGADIADLMDDDVIEILFGNIDFYWFDEIYTTEEVFSYAFIDTAFEIVEITSDDYLSYFPGEKGEWTEDDYGWRYQKEDGSYLMDDWERIGGQWYYFDEDGYSLSGWVELGVNQYYFDADGMMLRGWLEEDDLWFYFKQDGTMVTGWWEIGGDWYYFDETGRGLTDEWSPEGHYLNADGVWEESAD